jgi:hypothetical protein
MVTRSNVGATSVTLSDRGTKDSKVEDTGANTTGVKHGSSELASEKWRAGFDQADRRLLKFLREPLLLHPLKTPSCASGCSPLF